ncbi:MAG: hypothetical protein ACLFR1_13020 [Spirochaetia bacterium]
MKKHAVYSILLILFFFSCTVEQEMLLREDLSGNASLQVNLNEALVQYIYDLTLGFSGEYEMENLFDQAQIRRVFAETEGVRLESVSTSGISGLSMNVSFDNITEVFSSIESDPENPVISYSEDEDSKTIEIIINRGNFDDIARLSPLYESPVYLSLGPSEEYPVSEDEYREILAFALEEYLDQGDLSPLLASSVLQITVSFEGEILSHQGGERNGNTITYSIPVVRVLSLENPVNFRVRFR